MHALSVDRLVLQLRNLREGRRASMEFGLAPSVYEDGFARASLPPLALWPRLEIKALGERYPAVVNAAVEILDRAL